jgi:hypothetical protein
MMDLFICPQETRKNEEQVLLVAGIKVKPQESGLTGSASRKSEEERTSEKLSTFCLLRSAGTTKTLLERPRDEK